VTKNYVQRKFFPRKLASSGCLVTKILSGKVLLNRDTYSVSSGLLNYFFTSI